MGVDFGAENVRGHSESGTGVSVLCFVEQLCVKVCFFTTATKIFSFLLAATAGGALFSQLEIGDVAGVVAAVDILAVEDTRLPNESHELVRDIAVPRELMLALALEMGVEAVVAAEHAAHCALSVAVGRGTRSAFLPLARLRSSSSHSTTLSRLLKSSDWAGVLA